MSRVTLFAVAVSASIAPPVVMVAAETVISPSAEPAGVLSLIERVGIPVAAAVMATWVAYKLANQVIHRAWEIEDERRKQEPIATKRYEDLLADHIRITTVVADAIKRCNRPESDATHR